MYVVVQFKPWFAAIYDISIYTLSDLGNSSNLIG